MRTSTTVSRYVRKRRLTVSLASIHKLESRACHLDFNNIRVNTYKLGMFTNFAIRSWPFNLAKIVTLQSLSSRRSYTPPSVDSFHVVLSSSLTIGLAVTKESSCLRNFFVSCGSCHCHSTKVNICKKSYLLFTTLKPSTILWSSVIHYNSIWPLKQRVSLYPIGRIHALLNDSDLPGRQHSKTECYRVIEWHMDCVVNTQTSKLDMLLPASRLLMCTLAPTQYLLPVPVVNGDFSASCGAIVGRILGQYSPHNGVSGSRDIASYKVQYFVTRNITSCNALFSSSNVSK